MESKRLMVVPRIFDLDKHQKTQSNYEHDSEIQQYFKKNLYHRLTNNQSRLEKKNNKCSGSYRKSFDLKKINWK